MQIAGRHDYDALFARVKQGDAKAYEGLFKAQYPALLAYATTIVGAFHAEEIVQDVMLSLWENRESIVVQRSIRHYLYGAIRYRCLTHLRRNRLMNDVHQFLYEAESSFFTETDLMETLEVSHKLSEAMDALPDSCKEAFEMNRFQDLSYKEIAVRLKTTIKSVDYKIQKALKILRESLRDYK